MLDHVVQATRARVATLVGGILVANGKPGAIAPDDRLVDAGLTSMDMVNLMLAVEAEFDIMIPPGEITPGNFRSIATVEALVDKVRADAA